MGTALALCGAVAGWSVSMLMTRRRVAGLGVRWGDADARAETQAAAQAEVIGKRGDDGRSDRSRAESSRSDGSWSDASEAESRQAEDNLADVSRTSGTRADANPEFAERAFMNIGRRVQAIVHKQLADLSQMQEQHGSDPAVFADLMRLDHATALIGRFADSLVVLAGERPGRQWTEPVPVFSVLRGAMARIVDYRRVELAAAPEAELAGSAVEAVVHALAELLDNATRYSPPDSRVVLAARRTSDGVVIEVVDAGVGLAPQAAEHVARVLADPGSPGLDLADIGGSPRLGLAVIGRLAHTVGFQVTVRPSAAGGVRAQLLVPNELVLAPRGASAANTPAAPRVPSPDARTGRAALDDARSSADAGSRANGTPDRRPSGLPQRRRRPPTVPPTTAPMVAKTMTKTVKVPGITLTDTERGSMDTASGPGQWLDAFRGDSPQSEGEDGNRERGAAS